MDYFYDELGIRYHLAKTSSGKAINWVFLPGGPGADSRYLLTLVKNLDMPGNVWLVDLPGNGDNITENGYDFNNWFSLIYKIVTRFTNCILVGHSLGAMLPLLEPRLEAELLGFISINSAPCLWVTESEKAARLFGVPHLPEKDAFKNEQSQENYEKLLSTYLPYYFASDSLERGRAMFTDLPFPVDTALKVFKIMQEIKYNAAWIPQETKTLIIGGEQDYINPYSLFENDIRFDRKNIKKVLLKDCGHWSWIEKPGEIKMLFNDFLSDLKKDLI